jgi:hypothetical protein
MFLSDQNGEHAWLVRGWVWARSFSMGHWCGSYGILCNVSPNGQEQQQQQSHHLVVTSHFHSPPASPTSNPSPQRNYAQTSAMSNPPSPPILRDQIGLAFAPVEKAINTLATAHGLRVTKPACDLVNALLSGELVKKRGMV